MKTLFFCFVLLLTFSACHKNQPESQVTTVATKAIALGEVDALGQSTKWGIVFSKDEKEDMVLVANSGSGYFAPPPTGLINGNFYPGFGNYIFFSFLEFDIYVDLRKKDIFRTIILNSLKFKIGGEYEKNLSFDDGSRRIILTLKDDILSEENYNGVTLDRWLEKAQKIPGSELYLGSEEKDVFLIDYKEVGANKILEEAIDGDLYSVNEKGFFLQKGYPDHFYSSYLFLDSKSKSKAKLQVDWYQIIDAPYVFGNEDIWNKATCKVIKIIATGKKMIYHRESMSVILESVKESSEYYITKDLEVFEVKDGNVYKDDILFVRDVTLIGEKFYFVNPLTNQTELALPE